MDIDFDGNDEAVKRQSVEEVERRKAEVRLAAYGYYAAESRKARVDAIKVRARETGIPRENITIRPDSMDAVCDAYREAQKGVRVSIIGAVDDIQPPEDINDADLWREAVLAFLEDNRISMQALDLDKEEYKQHRSQPVAVAIRKYNRVRRRLEQLINERVEEGSIRKVMKGKKYGRPPYGYRIEEGVLTIFRPQAEAIMLVFSRKRQGVSAQSIINELKDKFEYEQKRTGAAKKQHWDHVKINRILSKASLYCLGRYTTGDGSTVESRDLAFLPAEWVDTVEST